MLPSSSRLLWLRTRRFAPHYPLGSTCTPDSFTILSVPNNLELVPGFGKIATGLKDLYAMCLVLESSAAGFQLPIS